MSGRVTRLVDVLMGVADLTGVDYTRQLSVSQRAAMIRLVKEHAAAVWEEYPWPETVRVEDRYFAEEWDPVTAGALTVYAADAIVRVTDEDGVPTYYERSAGDEEQTDYTYEDEEVNVAVTDANTLTITANVDLELEAGDVILVTAPSAAWFVIEEAELVVVSPPTYEVTITGHGVNEVSNTLSILTAPADSGVWAAVSSYVHELELAATGETEMYRVFAVYSEDPDTVANPDEVPFELMGGVIRLDPDEVGRVWVEFQIVPPPLNASVWTNAQAVVVGDVRYYETGNYGDCYQVVTAHNSEVPVGSAKWVKVEMPASIASAVKYLASADLLRADGKEDTALARERKATEALERAMSSFNNHQHQSARWRARVPA